MSTAIEGTPRPGDEHYPPGVTNDLRPDVATMLDAWQRTAAEHAAAPAIFYFDHVITFSEIDALSDALAHAWLDHGVTPGDRIAVYLQNDPQWYVCLIAAWKCGAAVACMNPMLRERELIHHLADSAPTVLVCLDSLYADVVSSVRDQLDVRVIITTSPRDMLGDGHAPDALTHAWGPRRTFPDVLDWTTLLAEHADQVPAAAHPTPADTALLTYTSGTTGAAKGAMNLHSGMVHNAQVYASWYAIDPEVDVVLGVAPLFHVTGSVAVLALSALTGAPIVLLHRFDAATTLAAIETYRVTFTAGASTAYNALATHPDAERRDLSSLTKAASGGAPISVALMQRVRERTGWTMRGVYGLTETTSPVTACPLVGDTPVDPASGALSVGVPVPGADIVIVDLVTGEPLPLGQVGEITVAGPMVVPGYWRAPEVSADTIRDGRLFTGDVGQLDEQGWLYVVDRKKDLINAGGYKVWPREVEDVLYEHPAVREAAVVGVPDDYRGETVMATVSLQSGASATAEELIAFTRQNLAAYKYPRIVHIVDELPKNLAGKILRRELRVPATTDG
jgi:long-chain acyl-CoA synthetase